LDLCFPLPLLGQHVTRALVCLLILSLSEHALARGQVRQIRF
jgi:hypothetical protein